MKKALWIFSLLLIPLVLFCQQDSTAFPVPGSIVDIFTDLKFWFASSYGIAGLTVFFTLMVSRFWKTINAIWKQIVAIAIALVLMIGGNLANLGFMSDFDALTTIAYGITIGFVANGVYDLKNILK